VEGILKMSPVNRAAATALAPIEPVGDLAHEFTFSDKDFRSLVQLAHDHAGISLADSKRNLVYSRVSRRLRALRMNSFREYRELLAGDEREIESFINSISTNHTKFFREAHHFQHFRTHTAHPFAQSRGRNVGGRLRVWSAGCSSGEEPYTIALVLKREIADFGGCDVRILATDIDTDILTKAARGEYTSSVFDEVPKSYHSFFKMEESGGTPDKVAIDRDVQSLITFRHLNLMGPWPFHGKFDAIFCRNVMIYFDTPTKSTLVDRFTQQLKPGGWLYIGHSESLIGTHPGLQLVGRTIYQRVA
jgi:chemotaxis protein methyltransferase CheR